MRDHWTIIDLPKTSTPDEIRTRQREFAAKWHPDRPNAPRDAGERLSKFNVACAEAIKEAEQRTVEEREQAARTKTARARTARARGTVGRSSRRRASPPPRPTSPPAPTPREVLYAVAKAYPVESLIVLGLYAVFSKK